jgi:hypothetical protein
MPRMSPGGTDASLLELVVGFFVAVSLITVITMVLRRRSGRQDLLGTQMREMETRTGAAAARDADARLREAAAQVADSRAREADAASANRPAQNVTAPPGGGPSPPPGGAAPLPGGAAPLPGGAAPLPGGAAPPPGGAAPLPGGAHDAMVDTFAWLRIAALVEAGQREQAVELLSATMTISAEEAEMLVDGLTNAGGSPAADH